MQGICTPNDRPVRSESVSGSRINLNRLRGPDETLRVGESGDLLPNISEGLSFYQSDAKGSCGFQLTIFPDSAKKTPFSFHNSGFGVREDSITNLTKSAVRSVM